MGSLNHRALPGEFGFAALLHDILKWPNSTALPEVGQDNHTRNRRIGAPQEVNAYRFTAITASSIARFATPKITMSFTFENKSEPHVAMT